VYNSLAQFMLYIKCVIVVFFESIKVLIMNSRTGFPFLFLVYLAAFLFNQDFSFRNDNETLKDTLVVKKHVEATAVKS
jgi:hypothetical protein